MKRDEKGNVVEESYHNSNNALITFPSDLYYYKKHRYDSLGNKVETATLDATRKLINNAFGIAVTRYRYDLNKNVIEELHFGSDEKLKEISILNEDEEVVPFCAIIRRQFDSKNNLIQEAYFGEDLKLTSPFGYALFRKKYDDLKNCIEISYHGSNDKLIECQDGYAISRFKYDDLLNVIELSYYGKDDQLIISKFGYALKKLKFESQNKCVEESFYDHTFSLISVDD